MNLDPGLVKKALEAVPYPIGKTNLIQFARQRGINDKVVGMLEVLPDQTFNSSAEIEELINKGKGILGNIGDVGGFFK